MRLRVLILWEDVSLNYFLRQTLQTVSTESLLNLLKRTCDGEHHTLFNRFRDFDTNTIHPHWQKTLSSHTVFVGSFFLNERNKTVWISIFQNCCKNYLTQDLHWMRHREICKSISSACHKQHERLKCVKHRTRLSLLSGICCTASV